jgi:hypothetical protein
MAETKMVADLGVLARDLAEKPDDPAALAAFVDLVKQAEAGQAIEAVGALLREHRERIETDCDVVVYRGRRYPFDVFQRAQMTLQRQGRPFTELEEALLLRSQTF